MDTASVFLCLCVMLHQVHGQLNNAMTSKAENQKMIIDAHNTFREMVKPMARNMLKMEWSPEAAANAQKVAEACTFEHSSPEQRTIQLPINAGCGENIFISSHEYDWKMVVQTWYDEHEDFLFGFGPTAKDKMVGHYTQVVWDKSNLVGCGVHKCEGKPVPYLYICQYCPQGNMMSRAYKPYEIGRPCEACPDSCEGKLCSARPQVKPKGNQYKKPYKNFRG